MTELHAERLPRVRFKHPVRVMPLDGKPRAWRTLSSNISKKGMFLRMPEPLGCGTKVALSFEAGGRVLPFAQAEVVWTRVNESKLPGRNTGFGVRFTNYLHPRAEELVGYLCTNLDTGRPLKTAVRKQRALDWKLPVAIAATLALVAAGTAWTLSVLSDDSEEAVALAVAAAPAKLVTPPAPVVVAPAAPTVPAAEPAKTPVAVAEVKAEPPPEPSVAVAKADPVSEAPVAAPKAEPAPEPATLALVEPPAEAQPVEPPPGKPSTDHVETSVITPSASGTIALPSGAASGLTWTKSGTTIHFAVTAKSGTRVAKVFAMHNPERVVFDIEGAKPKKSRTVETTESHLARIRVGARKSDTRVVLDFADAPTKIRATADGADVDF